LTNWAVEPKKKSPVLIRDSELVLGVKGVNELNKKTGREQHIGTGMAKNILKGARKKI